MENDAAPMNQVVRNTTPTKIGVIVGVKRRYVLLLSWYEDSMSGEKKILIVTIVDPKTPPADT